MGKKRRYITELDGIRAIAVIMVLAYHLKLALFKSGFLGVTVFFVLSGYLITGILISEVEEEGTIDLKNFWLRRIRRLVPAVMSMAVVIIFVSVVVNRIIFTKGCKDFLASVLGFNNWWQIFNKVSYFEAAGVPSPFTHCWSLAIETQFYLIYPLILLGIYKLVKSRGEGRANRGLLFAGVTLLLALISVILMIVLFDPQQDASRVYYGTDTRAFSLLFGALLAILWEYRMVPRRLSASVNMVLGSVSFAVLLVMTIAINGSSNFWYRGGQLKQKAKDSESEDTICTADLTDDEILEGLNLLLIGDSIAVDVTDDFYEIFPNSVSDTKIGRITSLGKQVLDSYIDEKKWEGEGVIFASLSNSPINGELEDIREKIGKDMPLFLTTVRIPHDTFEEESNSKIKKFVEENDHTYLIDWYAASEGHDEYFDADDTHLLSAGAKAYAKCIKEAVLDAYKKENIEIPKSRLVSSTDTSTDSSNDSSKNASTE